MPQMKAAPDWLKASVTAPRVGVDRTNRAILGAVIAQEGPFRESDPRGEFDGKALKQIVALMKEKGATGLKARFGHPAASSDAAGTALGRWKNPRLDSVQVKRGGESVELQAVRADLYLDASAFEVNPNGNIGEYMLTIAESDAGLISTSLVLQVDEEYRLNKDGTRKMDDDGNPLPPLWRPTRLHASDITDEGAAVDQLLSPNGADRVTAMLKQGADILDKVFAGQERDTIEVRCLSFLARYLDHRFPDPDGGLSIPKPYQSALTQWMNEQAKLSGVKDVKYTDADGKEVRLDEGANLPAGTVLTVTGTADADELKVPECPVTEEPCDQGCPSADECQREDWLAKDEPLHATIAVRVRAAE